MADSSGPPLLSSKSCSKPRLTQQAVTSHSVDRAMLRYEAHVFSVLIKVSPILLLFFRDEMFNATHQNWMIHSLTFSILSIAFPTSSVPLYGSKFRNGAHHALGATSIFRARTLYLSLFPCLTAIHYDGLKIRAINV